MNVKNIFKKENVMPVAILAAICLVVALLMGIVNKFTAPVIEQAELQAVQDSLAEVMPGGEFEKADIPDIAPSTVSGVYNDKISGGKVVTLVTMGYGGEIAITLGVDSEGKVTKAVVTKESETHGQSGMKTYTDNFAGLDAAEVSEVETFSQATISSTAIKNAIYDAMIALGYAAEKKEALPKTDSEILSLAEALAGKALNAVELSEDAPDTLKRLYKAGDVYVAYVVVPGEWVTVATEGMVAFDASGKILSVELYQWVVGHDTVYTQDFLDGFVGKDKDTVGDVELVTGATGTSGDFRNAVGEAINYSLPEFPIYRLIGILIACIAVGAAVAAVIYSKRRRKG